MSEKEKLSYCELNKNVLFILSTDQILDSPNHKLSDLVPHGLCGFIEESSRGHRDHVDHRLQHKLNSRCHRLQDVIKNQTWELGGLNADWPEPVYSNTENQQVKRFSSCLHRGHTGGIKHLAQI